MPHPELSRDHFDRQARYRRRVIIDTATRNRRWEETQGYAFVETKDIEGAVFLDEDAARAFDTERMDHSDDNGGWWEFDTWAEAEEWLRDQPNR